MKKNEEGEPIKWNIDGHELEITYPNKLYYPEAKITKLDLLKYYRSLASTMLPYFKNRPVTLRCYPRGIHDFSFYRRNFDQAVGDLITTVPYQELSQHKTIQVPIVTSEAGLVYLGSKGCIEFHLWTAVMPNYQYPDMVIFDLDISSTTSFQMVLDAAMCLNDFLKSKNIKGYVKTSGGTGLHVYVPIVPNYSYEYVRKWVKQVNKQLAASYPELITTDNKSRTTHQSERVVIDYLQNVISRNTAAPYTVRGKVGAPVSAPLTWQEVEAGHIHPLDFNLKNMPHRVNSLGDIFAGVLTAKQELSL